MESQWSSSRSQKSQSFVWTDDEVRLWLKVTKEYKVQKEGNRTDWESVRSIYDDVLQRLREKMQEVGKTLPPDGVSLDLPLEGPVYFKNCDSKAESHQNKVSVSHVHSSFCCPRLAETLF